MRLGWLSLLAEAKLPGVGQFQAKDVSTLLDWLKTSPEDPKKNRLLQYAYFLQQAVQGNLEVLKKLEAAKSDDPQVKQAAEATGDIVTQAMEAANADYEVEPEPEKAAREADPFSPVEEAPAEEAPVEPSKRAGILRSPVQGKGFGKGATAYGVLQKLPRNLWKTMSGEDTRLSIKTLQKYTDILNSIANAAEKSIKTEDVETYLTAFLGRTIIECLKT